MMHPVNGLTTFVLRHRRWIMVAWLAIVLAGVATLSSTTRRLSTEFKLPNEPSYIADSKITALYHNGGDTVPVVVAVTAPVGQVASPAQADRVLAAATAAVPGSRLADQLNTGDAAFATRDGRTSFGLIFTPPDNKDGFKDTAKSGTVPPGCQTPRPGAPLPSGAGSRRGVLRAARSGYSASGRAAGGAGAVCVTCPLAGSTLVTLFCTIS